MIKFAAFAATLCAAMFVNDIRQGQAQTVVTSYYAPAPSVGYMPVRRGLLGLRTGYVPVVTASAVPVTTYYAPAPSVPVTSYYAPTTATVSTYYAPATATVSSYYAPVAPVTTYYAPTVVQPVTTYYAPVLPTVVIRR